MTSPSGESLSYQLTDADTDHVEMLASPVQKSRIKLTSTYSILVLFNPFIPEFLVTLPSLNLGMFTDAKIWFQSKIRNRMANSVGPDETPRYEPSHLDLHCLHRYLFCFAGLKGFKLSSM